MKNRVLLIPASLMLLSSCAQDADIRNEYSTLELCKTDNNPQEIYKQLCNNNNTICTKTSIEELTKKYKCEEKIDDKGKRTYLGPAYPSAYYNNHGSGSSFVGGYWIGRSLINSSSIHVPSNSSSYSHSSFKSSFSGGRSSSIVRGGFSSSSRGFGG